MLIRQLLEGLGQLAKDTGVRIQTHLSECRPEVKWVSELEPWAENYTDVYAQTGILTDKTILGNIHNLRYIFDPFHTKKDQKRSRNPKIKRKLWMFLSPWNIP